MEDEGKSTCWACGADIDSQVTECPKCGMPIENKQVDSQDIDSFLDEAVDSMDLPSDMELPELPSDEVTEEETDLSYPEMPEIGESLDEVDIKSDIVSPISEEPTQITPVEIPEVEEVTDDAISDMPTIPDMDFDDFVDETLEEEELVVELPQLELSALSKKEIAKLFVPQLIYWSIVFFIISFISYEIIDPNLTLGSDSSVTSDQFEIHPEAFLFAWVSFLPMGWFFGYKLRLMGIKPKIQYAILFLFSLLLFQLIIVVILLFYLNPNLQINGSLELSNFSQFNYILSSFMIFTIYNYLVTAFTAGIVIFYSSYKSYWSNIYELTPLSDIKSMG
ncbi:MAG: zinc ribbon domain-containing protein [Candidatus Kariarchaeaceae archaeon]|jgi:hypothetical protein